jgi:hypothetical protein
MIAALEKHPIWKMAKALSNQQLIMTLGRFLKSNHLTPFIGNNAVFVILAMLISQSTFLH